MILATTSDQINAQGGLILVGKALDKVSKLPTLLKSVKESANQRFSHSDILKVGIGLLSQGRTHFSDTELFRQEESQIMAHALGLNAQPSEATFRQRFNRLANNPDVLNALQTANLNLLRSVKPTPLQVAGRSYIANDIDVTPLNNEGSQKREKVSYTYKGFAGYAPHHEQPRQRRLPPTPRTTPRLAKRAKRHPGFFKRKLQTPRYPQPQARHLSTHGLWI